MCVLFAALFQLEPSPFAFRTFNDIIYYSLLGYSHKRPLCNTRHTGKTTQTAVTPPETLVSCTPGRPRNRITHVSIPGSGTFLT
jgi:hypothetical protein